VPCPVQGLQMEPYWLINRSAKRFIYLCCHIRDLFYSAFCFVILIDVHPLLGPVSVDLEDIFSFTFSDAYSCFRPLFQHISCIQASWHLCLTCTLLISFVNHFYSIITEKIGFAILYLLLKCVPAGRLSILELFLQFVPYAQAIH
jgi:hypothetical protein